MFVPSEDPDRAIQIICKAASPNHPHPQSEVHHELTIINHGQPAQSQVLVIQAL